MELENFLKQLLETPNLTLNELSVLIELGYADFSRNDLLKNEDRVPIGTYSPAALTRTLQKLTDKGLITTTTKEDSAEKMYALNDRCNGYDRFTTLLLEIGRSRLMTLNATRTALYLILNDNKYCTARFIAKGINLDADYLANTVLPRMYVINIIKYHKFNQTKEEKFSQEDLTVDSLLVFSLVEDWKGYVSERWLQKKQYALDEICL